MSGQSHGGQVLEHITATTHSQSPISLVSRRRSTRECETYGRTKPCVEISLRASVEACIKNLFKAIRQGISSAQVPRKAHILAVSE